MSNSVPMPAWFPAPAENVVETDSIRDEMPYSQRLMKYVKSSSENDIAFLEYRTLHRINITHLQNELATIKSSIDNNPFPTEVELKEIRETLHTYGLLMSPI